MRSRDVGQRQGCVDGDQGRRPAAARSRRRRDHQHIVGDGDERLADVAALCVVKRRHHRDDQSAGAGELGVDRITVNALAPGFTLTEASLDLIENAAEYGVARGAIKRPAGPHDMVGAALFLASAHAALMTGQTLIVDGGRQFL
jgi:hypothetical protein